MSVTIENNSNKDLSVLEGLIEKYLPYAQERMGYDKPVSISLISDEQNAANPLGRTAYYEPDTSKITIYVDGRHPKDMMRSISHELVHHTQNCRGDLDNMGSTDEGYAQTDDHLRKMEEEAYTVGNLCFRDFEDAEKAKPLQETIYKGKGSNITMNNEQLKQIILETVKSKLAEIAAQNNTTETLEETTEVVEETVVEEEINEEEVVEEAAVEEAEVDERRKTSPPAVPGTGRRIKDLHTGIKNEEKVEETVTEEEVVEESAEEIVEETAEAAPLKEWYDDSLYGKLTKLWAKQELTMPNPRVRRQRRLQRQAAADAATTATTTVTEAATTATTTTVKKTTGTTTKAAKTTTGTTGTTTTKTTGTTKTTAKAKTATTTAKKTTKS